MTAFNSVPLSRIFRSGIFISMFVLALLSFPEIAQAQWQATVGAQSESLGRQALAFLPNELWIHTGDNVTWTDRNLSMSSERSVIRDDTISRCTPATMTTSWAIYSRRIESRAGQVRPSYGLSAACSGTGRCGHVVPSSCSPIAMRQWKPDTCRWRYSARRMKSPTRTPHSSTRPTDLPAASRGSTKYSGARDSWPARVASIRTKHSAVVRPKKSTASMPRIRT